MFLSTPPSRVATVHFDPAARRELVSIHATLAGGDFPHTAEPPVQLYVSIHATLAGGDFHRSRAAFDQVQFLSTPPSRVATKQFGSAPDGKGVSIHATLAGGDAPALLF